LRKAARDYGSEMGHERAKMVRMRPEWGRFAQVGGIDAHSSWLAAIDDTTGLCAHLRGLSREQIDEQKTHRPRRPDFHNRRQQLKKRQVMAETDDMRFCGAVFTL